jgi:hypothetical protein
MLVDGGVFLSHTAKYVVFRGQYSRSAVFISTLFLFLGVHTYTPHGIPNPLGPR